MDATSNLLIANAPNSSVSIILVNFNGADLLRPCLNSLASAIHKNTEVIVVDNASSDHSLKVLAEFSWVKVVASPTNSGFAGGNNLGLKHCSGDYVLLLNTDTIVAPGFLEPLVNHLNTHPTVGIVQGKMLLSRHGGVLDICGSYLTSFGFLYHYGYYKPDGPLYSNAAAVFTGKGACLMFRRSLLERVGGYLFNEDFFCYYEETDFCHRAWVAGFETHFVPGSVIEHLQGGTSERTHGSGFALRQFITNQTFGLLSNLSLGSRCRILPFYFSLFFASMCAGLLTGNRVVFGAHWNAIKYCLKNLKKIHQQRTLIKTIRKVSDRAIFAKVMITPRLDYFWKTFRGTLASYADDSLPPSAISPP